MGETSLIYEYVEFLNKFESSVKPGFYHNSRRTQAGPASWARNIYIRKAAAKR